MNPYIKYENYLNAQPKEIQEGLRNGSLDTITAIELTKEIIEYEFLSQEINGKINESI